MAAEEVDTWDAFFSYEPPLEVRFGFEMARLIAAVYRAAGSDVKAKDILVDYEYIQPTPEELASKIKLIMGVTQR